MFVVLITILDDVYFISFKVPSFYDKNFSHSKAAFKKGIYCFNIYVQISIKT